MAKAVLILANRFQHLPYLSIKVSGVLRGEVAQFTVLEPSPYLLHRHQLRRVGRQFFQFQATFRVRDQLVDRVASVDTTTVPNDHERPGHPLYRARKKFRHRRVGIVAVDQRIKGQGQTVSSGRQRQSSDHRHFLSVPGLLLELPGMAFQGPATASQRRHQQSALVQKQQISPSPSGMASDAWPILGQPTSDRKLIPFAGNTTRQLGRVTPPTQPTNAPDNGGGKRCSILVQSA